MRPHQKKAIKQFQESENSNSISERKSPMERHNLTKFNRLTAILEKTMSARFDVSAVGAPNDQIAYKILSRGHTAINAIDVDHLSSESDFED